jgi:hypothetical protein
MSTLQSVIDGFFDYYSTLDKQPPTTLAVLYHPDAVLIDPFGQQQGIVAIQRYFRHLLANVQQCRFTLDAPLSNSDHFMVTWNMHWSHPNIHGGASLMLHGCSVVNVQDGTIVRQRDYYDIGEMLYEHLPILGWAVRKVKRRIHS